MATIPPSKYKTIDRLYYDEKKTMNEIAQSLGVSIDAVTYFMRKHTMPRRSFSEANKVVFSNKEPSFKIKPKQGTRAKELEVAGAMLYWGEGYKSKKATGIDFANSDPEMVKIFVSFLRSRYKLDEKRMRAFVYCYKDQNPKVLEKFWGTVTNIPIKQFTKPYVRKDFQKNQKRKMKNGLVHIRYSDKKLLNDLLSLIESYKGKLSVGARAANWGGL